MSKIYLDTCIAIYFVEKHPDYAEHVELLINSLGENDTLCHSPLVKLECFVKPYCENDAALEKLFELFFSAQEALEIAADRFDEAARLRADFSFLKTPDALHLATALHHGCDEFWTNDNRLNTAAPSLVRNILVS